MSNKYKLSIIQDDNNFYYEVYDKDTLINTINVSGIYEFKENTKIIIKYKIHNTGQLYDKVLIGLYDNDILVNEIDINIPLKTTIIEDRYIGDILLDRNAAITQGSD